MKRKIGDLDAQIAALEAAESGSSSDSDSDDSQSDSKAVDDSVSTRVVESHGVVVETLDKNGNVMVMRSSIAGKS